MALARVSVFVDADTELRPRPFVGSSGGRVAWLELGDGGEASVWGSPAAMRRLTAALLAVAAAAEQLPERRPSGEAALQVVDGS
jgi:hypothetical protein